MENIKGKISYVIFENNGYCVFMVKDKKNTGFKCEGNCPVSSKDIESLVEIKAELSDNPRYGKQYKVVSLKFCIPEDKDGIKAFLSSGRFKGIGKKTASAIVDEYGDKAIQVIKKSPDKLLSINGISRKKVSELFEKIEQFSLYEKIYELTKGIVTDNEITKIIKRYGNRAMSILKKNPYKIITDINGIGFVKADRIALSTGIDKYSIDRILPAIAYVVEQYSSTKGDCFVMAANLKKTVLSVLNPLPEPYCKDLKLQKRLYNILISWDIDKKELYEDYQFNKEDISRIEHWKDDCVKFAFLMNDAILRGISEGTFHVHNNSIAINELYQAEKEVAGNIYKIKEHAPVISNRTQINDFIVSFEKKNGIIFADEQKEAVAGGLMSRIHVISGGPGRGKTTILKAIVGYWNTYVSKEVFLLAPTGKAAQRIGEAVGETYLPPCTIHRLIALIERDGDYNGCVPGSDSLIICDEASMIDIKLARQLTEIAKDSTLILVGDKDQLPPVGAGNFFKDMISSGLIDTSNLITSFRNAGNIAKNASSINNGSTYLRNGQDFKVEYMDREDILGSIISDYMDLIHHGVDPKDIGVLTLTRQRGAVSVQNLNYEIKSALNPDFTKKSMFHGFSEGDRVMQVVNDYKMDTYNDVSLTTQNEPGVFNGDTGTVARIDIEKDEMVVLMDDGRYVAYSDGSAEELILSFAITVHKSQGSEYKYLLFALSLDQYTLLNRAIIYTAATRAKVEEHLYCEKKAFDIAVKNIGNSCRNTRLSEFLKEIIPGPSVYFMEYKKELA